MYTPRYTASLIDAAKQWAKRPIPKHCGTQSRCAKTHPCDYHINASLYREVLKWEAETLAMLGKSKAVAA